MMGQDSPRSSPPTPSTSIRRRADQLARLTVFDGLVASRAYAKSIIARLMANGNPTGQIINLGQQQRPALEPVFKDIRA